LSVYMRTAGGLQSPPAPKSKPKKWLSLLLGVLLIWGFVFVVAPLIDRVPAIGRAHGIVQDEGIEAGAFWYADVEKVGKAATFMRNVRDFAPSGAGTAGTRTDD